MIKRNTKKGTIVKINSKKSKNNGAEGKFLGFTEGDFAKVEINGNVIRFAKDSLEIVKKETKKGVFDELKLNFLQSKFAIAMFCYSCLCFGDIHGYCFVHNGKIMVNVSDRATIKILLDEIYSFCGLNIPFESRNKEENFAPKEKLTWFLKKYFKANPQNVEVVERNNSLRNFCKYSPNARAKMFYRGGFLFYKNFVIYYDKPADKAILENAKKFGVLEAACEELYKEKFPNAEQNSSC